MAEEEAKSKKRLNKAKAKVSDFTDGQEGSIFWAIKWVGSFVKLVVRSINESLSIRRNTKKYEQDESNGTNQSSQSNQSTDDGSSNEK